MTRPEVIAWLRANGFAAEAERVAGDAGLELWRAAMPRVTWQTTASGTLFADLAEGRMGAYHTPSDAWFLWVRVSGWRVRIYAFDAEEGRDFLVARLRRYLDRPATPRTERRRAAVQAVLDVVGVS